jgi:subtilase family serine protease
MKAQKEKLERALKQVRATVVLGSLLLGSFMGWAQEGAASRQSPFLTADGVERAAKDGKIIIPSSSIVNAEDIGVRAHTNTILYVHPDNSQPGPTWETPASIACVYHLVPQVSGCPISGTTTNPSGGLGTIAIVDAYDYPTAVNDLAVFSSKFGLPAANLEVEYAYNTRPPQDPSGGWELEEALDIEWAHAMAPNARIILVEAASNSYSDLFYAESLATNEVAAYGGGEVTNSWGGSEFTGEQAYDSYFNTPGVVYFASSGDSAFALSYPAVSPNVIAAGGTSIQRNPAGSFTGETYWDNQYGGGGGGLSQYETIPSYQSVITSIVGTHRGVPDVSSDADPVSGVAVYDTTPFQGNVPAWIQLGGTSVSSPTLAGIANVTGVTNFSSSNETLTEIYTDYGSSGEYAAEFRDITQGNGNCKIGWDICTGVGSPLTYASLAVPDFGLSVTPILVGKRYVKGFTVAATAGGGFNGTVALTCSMPAGNGCTLNPTSIKGSGTSLLTGSYLPLQWTGATVTGTSGKITHTVGVRVY